MTRFRLILPLVAAMLLASCATPASTPSSEPENTPTPEASVVASAEPSEAPSASDRPSEEPSETPEVTPPSQGGGFEILPNPAADALFLVRDDCQNLRDGYQLQFPDDWYTNTEYRNFAPCVWFSPDSYETDGDAVPPEIAITIEWMAGPPESRDAEVVADEDGEVGFQSATRTEWDDDTYRYVIRLGRTLEEGPNLVVTTSAEMGGDYELNKAVLDRILATIEFVGSTQ